MKLRSPAIAFASLTLLLFASPSRLAAAQSDALAMADCEQDNVASDAIRACTGLILNGHLDSAGKAHVYALRARSWLTEDDPAAAAADFSAVLALDPGNVPALTGRAGARTLQGKNDEAIADWTLLIAIEPANDAYYRKRGASYLAAGLQREALADYQKSLELNPRAIDAYIGRAFVYESLRQRDEALAEFEKAAAAEPNYLPIYWERAEMADRWGERDLAIKNYEIVLKINGIYAHARKALDRLGIHTPP